MKKILIAACVINTALGSLGGSSFVGATVYDITNFSGSNNSIIARPSAFVAGDTLNIQNNITSTSPIGSLGVFVLNIAGNGNVLSGGAVTPTYLGFSVLAGSDYTFNSTNLSRFKSTVATAGGAITNTGTLNFSDGGFESNSSVNGGAVYSTASATMNGNSFNSNIATASGGAIYNTATGTMVLTDNEFSTNTAISGGAIYNTGTLTINGTMTGLDDSATSTSTFYGNTATTGSGGALYNTGNLTVDGVKFDTNKTNATAISMGGGAIYSAAAVGKQLTVRNSLFTNNTAIGTGRVGGAIYNYSGVADINGTNFIGNSATVGGAIYNAGTITIGSDSSAPITATSFYGNQITGTSGGAIHNTGTLTIGLDAGGTTTSFANNQTTATNGLGGAIYAAGTLNLKSGTSFDNNKVTGLTSDGGALYTIGTTTIVDNDFSANTATRNGGAIYNNSGIVTIAGGTYSNNESTTAGGAIYNTTSAALRVFSISNADFSDNKSTYGGAIYNVNTSTSNAIFKNLTFENNIASGLGGAIYNAGTLRIQADGEESSFSGNMANGVANDLYLASGTVYLNAGNGGSITFDGSIASALKTNALNINSATGSATLLDGVINFNGGISTAGLTISGGTSNFGRDDILNIDENNVSFAITGGVQNFVRNSFINGSRIGLNDLTPTEAESLNISNSVFAGTGSVGASGGALVITLGAVNIDNSSFSGYTSTLYGGAISNAGTALVTLLDTYFSGNTAVSGGALYNTGNATITGTLLGTDETATSTSTFENNTTTTGSGGALYNTGNLTVDGVKFDTNKTNATAVNTGGGAIYSAAVAGKQLKVQNSLFTNNTTIGAGKVGGAIYNASGLADSIDTNFFGNSSAFGGAIYNTGNVTITGTLSGTDETATSTSTFENNTTSTGSGGALYNTGNLTVDGVKFDTNKTNATAVNTGGGAIYSAATAGKQLTVKNSLFADNTAITGTSVGGAIYNSVGVADINSTNFIGNSATAGGAIYIAGTMTIGSDSSGSSTHTSFDGNQATSTLGGAIRNTGTLTIGLDAGGTTTSFTNNSVAGDLGMGGAIASIATLSLKTGTSFDNNSVTGATSDGGAIYATGTTTIVDNDFTNNSATRYGGAIYSISTNFVMTDSDFDGNGKIASVPQSLYGGAVFNNGGVMTINGGTYSNNESTTAGGAIYNTTSTVSRVFSISNADFSGNKSTNGGAIYTASGSTGHSLFKNLTFENNIASGLGGAIYNAGTLRIQADGEESSFSGNMANGVANDLYLASGTVYLNAGNGGSITFDGSIDSALKTNALNINTATGSATLLDGVINFNDGISTATLNIHNGTSNFGRDDILNVDENNVSFTITGGVQNFIRNSFYNGSRIGLNDLTPTEAESLNISNSTFTGAGSVTGSGGALVVTLGTANIDNTSFSGYTSTTSGGAVSNAGNTTIAGVLTGIGETATSTSTFYNNTATAASGGAIVNTGNLTVDGVKFDSNKTNATAANTGGGAICNAAAADKQLIVENSLFTNNTALGTSRVGGAIYNYSGVVDINGSNFIGNSATAGGAIYNAGTLTIGLDAGGTTTSFANNQITATNGMGGAIYAAGTLNLKTGTSFDNNKVTGLTSDGGALYVVGTVNIADNDFANNSATRNGGAIYAASINFIMSDSDFSDNGKVGTDAITLNGGAVYNNNGIMAITGGSFINNASTTAGGAIYNTTTIAGRFLGITGTEFSGNASVSGGAIYNAGITTTTLLDNSFTNNTAVNGGAIYNIRGVSLTGTITGSGDTATGTTTFSNNTATTGSGGAIYNTGDLTIDGVVFDNNTSETTATTSGGGAIYSAAAVGKQLIIKNSLFAENTATTGVSLGGAIYNSAGIAGINGTNFIGNSATAGGAIYIAGTMTIGSDSSGSSTHTSFEGNQATLTLGGAIRNIGTLTIGLDAGGTTTSFTNNSVAGDLGMGGAIASGGTLNLKSGTSFDNNRVTGATSDGGAVYTIGTASIANNEFKNNSATGSGGAIYSAGSNVTVSGTDFISNGIIGTDPTTVYGGAIYNANGIMNITGGSFKDNSSTTAGGAIYNATVSVGKYLSLSGVEFSGNTSLDGGAIYNPGGGVGYVTVKDSTFENNIASGLGGAIYNAGTVNIQASDSSASLFSGNKANGLSNAIFLGGGTLNLNAGNNATITFNDKIASSSILNTININNGGSLNTGNIIFNESVSNATINMQGGTLTLGQVGNNLLTDATGVNPSNSYFDNVNLNLDGGTLNLANGNVNDVLNVNTFFVASIASIFFDANLSTGQSDSILVNTAAGIFNGAKLNILADGDASTLVLFKNQKSPVLGAFASYTNDYKYSFNQSYVAGVYDIVKMALSGLNSAVKSTDDPRSFSATADVVINDPLGTMGGANSTLTIFGNNKNIAGSAFSGINVLSGQTLNIVGVGSVDEFGTILTAFSDFRNCIIKNSGTSKIDDSVFSNNYSDASIPSVIINTGVGASVEITNSIFENNYSSTNYPGVISNSASMSIKDSSFTNNRAMACSGGVLFNSGGNVDIDNVEFTDNYAVGQVGGAVSIIFTNYVINNSTFTGNYSNGKMGGAFYNYSAGPSSYVSNTSFNNNHSSLEGGAIYNESGTMNFVNVDFDENYSTGRNAGAIYCNGTLNITNSSFTNNHADAGRGGAIAGYGTLNIKADNGTTLFSGNTDITGSNAIYNLGGINLNAGNGGTIIFDDKIESSDASKVINVNSGTTLNSGEVVLNNTIIGYTINLQNGTLTLGKTGSNLTNTYLSNLNLNLNAGVLNLENGKTTDVLNLNNFTSAENASLRFDADLSTNQNDIINASSASGTLNVSHLNIITDGTASSLTLFSNGIAPTLAAFTAYTNRYKYLFNPSLTAGAYDITRSGSSGLNQAVEDPSVYRSFSTTEDTTVAYDLGTMAGADSTLDINGNHYNIDGANFAGVNILAGQTLNVSGVGDLNADGSVNKSYHGFLSANGGAINNSGELNISNSIFTQNTATGLGGSIYNGGLLNIVANDGGTTLFSGNTDIAGSNAIYNAGTINLNAGNQGAIIFNDKITSSDINNIININSGAILNSGNVIFNNTVSDSTINLENGTLTLGETGSSLTNTYLSNVNLNLNSGTLNLENGKITDVLNLNNFTSTSNASLRFDANLSNNQNDIINASSASGILNISHLNIVADGTASSLTLFSNEIAPVLSAFSAYTTTYQYRFTPGNTLGTYGIVRRTNGGLNEAVEDSSAYRSFSATKDSSVDYALGTMAGADSTLDINGNHYSIDGIGLGGINVLAGQTLNVIGVGALNADGSVNKSYHGFSSASGGAINNSGELNISNSIFTQNTASGLGGAIYNSGTLNISASNNSTTLFSGNTDSNGFNAIHLQSGTLNLNSGTNANIIFNDKISSGNINNIININSGAILNSGNVIFNNTVSDSTINLENGTLTLGETGSSLTDTYLSNVNLNLNAGTLNLENGKTTDVLNLNNFTSTSNALLRFDADLSTNQNDTINTNSASGTLNVSHLNIVADGTASSLTLFSNGIAPTLNAFSAYTTGYKYLFTSGATLGTYEIQRLTAGSLNYAVADPSSYRSFSATSDTTVDAALGTMGGAGSTLDINGNNNNINGAGFGGVKVLSGQTLNVSGVGALNANGSINKSYNGFSSQDGGAINNEGTLNVANSIFTQNTASGLGGAIYNSGTLNIVASDNGVALFSNNADSTGSNAIYLQGGTMNLNAGNNANIVFNDKIDSSDKDNVININKAGSLDLSDPLVGAPTEGRVVFNNSVSNSTVNLYGGTMSLGKDNNLDGNNMGLYGGTLNLANNLIGVASFNNLAVNGNTNLRIDADLANSTADKITSANSVTGSGKLNVSYINILSDANVKTTDIQIADNNVKGYINVSATEAESQLYKYTLSYNPTSGTMGFVSSKNFNPSIITPAVASSVGSFLNQSATYGEAIGRMDGVMFMPKADRLLMEYRNKTASADGKFVFSPTLLPEEGAGTWFKQYTTFENVPLNNGPNVSNIGYGVLVGKDSELQSLGHGYRGYITAYAGYNGSNQHYGNVSSAQNGGLLGITGTVYKGNFFAALTGSGGASNGNNYTTAGIDNFTTVTAGAALKTGYNFEIMSGKLIVQPSLMTAYTFVNTFDYTSASGASITSDPINAIQVTPGLKIIGNLKNGWQPYLAANMVWNFMDNTKFYANDVQLPQLSVAPYFEYGFGVQRKWGERFTGFGQAMARGGGRNGVALQFGLRWAL